MLCIHNCASHLNQTDHPNQTEWEYCTWNNCGYTSIAWQPPSTRALILVYHRFIAHAAWLKNGGLKSSQSTYIVCPIHGGHQKTVQIIRIQSAGGGCAWVILATHFVIVVTAITMAIAHRRFHDKHFIPVACNMIGAHRRWLMTEFVE